MHENSDDSWEVDSWEVAAQAALDIHRRVLSAQRERFTAGTGTREVRPRTATSRSRSEVRTRPVSAPPGRVKRRPPAVSNSSHPAVLVPSLANASTVNKISRAEMEAWATLRHNVEGEPPGHNVRRHRESRPMVTFDRARPNSSASEHHSDYTRVGGTPSNRQGTNAVTTKPRETDMFCDHLVQLGPDPIGTAAAAATAKPTEQQGNRAGRAQQRHQGAEEVSPTPLASTGKYSTRFRGTADDSCIGDSSKYHDRSGNDGAGRWARGRGQDLDGCRTTRVEHDAVRQRQNERDRSDISARFLREHARKAMKEEKAFLRMLRAEAKAEEDGQVEMIHRATQWSRDIGKGVVYLPHCVGGKLHVLKIENGFAAARPDEAGGRGGGGSRNLEDSGRVISVDSFVKGDHARLEKERRTTAQGGVVGNTDQVATRSTKLSGPPKSKGNTSRKHVRGRPNAVDTCRELHQLVRDTVGLVDVLTRQAVELEGQGWNRPPGGSQNARRRGTRR